MSNFRDHKNDESAEESGDDESTIVSRLNTRPKAVPKRRIPTQNGDNNTSNDRKLDESQQDQAKPASNAGKLWADMAVMQTLEEKIATGSSSTIHDLRDRGSETYAWDLGDKKFDLSKRKRHRPDDISDSLWDEPMEGKTERTELTQIKEYSEIEDDSTEHPKTPADPVTELWNGVDTGSVELPIEQRKHWRPPKGGRGGHFKRFKRDHQQSSSSKKHFQSKDKKQQEFVPPEKFLPRRLLTPNYDQEKLFKTVLDPEALDEEQLVRELATALGEKEPDLIRKVIGYTGKQVAVDLFKECQEVEKRGGMLTKKEDRRKTPGGVYLQLFNQREDIPEESKKELFAFGSALMKKSGNVPKWWDKKKQKQQKKMMTAPPDIENNDLPKCSELFKPEDALPNDPADIQE